MFNWRPEAGWKTVRKVYISGKIYVLCRNMSTDDRLPLDEEGKWRSYTLRNLGTPNSGLWNAEFRRELV